MEKLQYMTFTCKNELYFYILRVYNTRKIDKSINYNSIKNNKIFWKKLKPGCKRFVYIDCKILLKEIKGINKWKDMIC